MKVRNVHSRELAAAPEQVGALIDTLGGPADRLWPADRWPTTPLEVEGPLAVGAASSQGLLRLTQIRQVIDEYEPGRRLVFRFAPGLGIVGTHRLEVQPLGPDRTRLTHALDCRLEPKMLPVYPVLIRQHDALVEDLLDRAELATTGEVARPARWPASVRIANAIELRVARRRGMLPAPERVRPGGLARVSGAAVPTLLVAIAALHAAWAIGWSWPAASERELAEHVLSSDERERLAGELPPAPLTWAVAVGLAGAGAVVRAVGTGTRSRALRGAAWAVAGVFLARGAVPLPSYVIRGSDDTYERLDLAIYSPLCLAIAAGTAVLLGRTTPRAATARGGWPYRAPASAARGTN